MSLLSPKIFVFFKFVVPMNEVIKFIRRFYIMLNTILKRCQIEPRSSGYIQLNHFIFKLKLITGDIVY